MSAVGWEYLSIYKVTVYVINVYQCFGLLLTLVIDSCVCEHISSWSKYRCEAKYDENEIIVMLNNTHNIHSLLFLQIYLLLYLLTSFTIAQNQLLFVEVK